MTARRGGGGATPPGPPPSCAAGVPLAGLAAVLLCSRSPGRRLPAAPVSALEQPAPLKRAAATCTGGSVANCRLGRDCRYRPSDIRPWPARSAPVDASPLSLSARAVSAATGADQATPTRRPIPAITGRRIFDSGVSPQMGRPQRRRLARSRRADPGRTVTLTPQLRARRRPAAPGPYAQAAAALPRACQCGPKGRSADASAAAALRLDVPFRAVTLF